MKSKAVRHRHIKRPLLARNLWFLRRCRGLTHKEVAAALYVERSAYSRYEEGEARPPYEALLRLAELYGTTVQALLTEDLSAHTSKTQI